MRGITVFLALSALIAFHVNPVSSDDGMDAGLEAELQWLQAETFVVTASKTVENMEKSAASITVITDREIRNMGARTLMDVLRTVPGLGITQSTVWFEEIESRGVKTWLSEKILIMLNSHPLDSNLINGGCTLVHGNLPVNNIKRIEVIRGPASALYGANAFLALVNVITRGAGDIDGLEVAAGISNYNTRQYNVLFGEKMGGMDAVVGFNFSETDGFRAFVEQDLQTALDGQMGTDASVAPGYTDSWEKNWDVNFQLGYGGLKFQGNYLKRDIGPYFGINYALNDDSNPQFEAYFGELGYTREINRQVDLSARLYRDYYHLDNFWEIYPEGFAGAFPDGFNLEVFSKNTKTGGEALVTYRLSESNRAVAGVMRERQNQYDVGQKTNYHPVTGAPLGAFEDVSDSLNWNRDVSRDFWAAYVEDLWDVRRDLRLTVGARYDHYSDFGGVFNPRAGLAWEFTEGYGLKLMYGRAFRAPVFAELYNTNNPAFTGNPSLEPEKVKTVEGSLGAAFTDRLSGRATVFYSDIEDIVGQSAPDAGGTRVHINAFGAQSRGGELEVRARLKGGAYVAANYTYQNPKDSGGGGRLPDVPSHRGNIIANFRVSRHLNLYTHLFLKGSVPRAKGDARDRVAGHGILNATAIAKRFSSGLRGVEVRLSVYNLFDKAYVDPAPMNTLPFDYPRPGRHYVAEVRLKVL